MASATEFLPICDNLFNVISLAAYFCDCVFDCMFGYALLEQGRINFFVIVVLIISLSLIVSQIVSIKWFFQRRALNKRAIAENQDTTVTECSASSIEISKYSVIGLHCCQLGIFWRYAKLFVPVDLRFVKCEVRDLCILRLVHAFCEAAPMLLIQSYILMTLQSNDDSNINSIKIKTLGGQLSTHLVQQSTIAHQYQQKTFRDLNTISAFLSLFSVCWALASFSKNVRVQNVHRLVLTWIGVIFQFFWRLGTVTSRVLSLTAYASVYKKWIFLVIILHWISMFLWLISPKNAFHGEQISRLKKMLLSGLVAFIYVFAYININLEVNHKQKMMIFYVVMFLENSLLVSLWTVGIWSERLDDWYKTPLYVFLFFFAGIFIMMIYYKYFHIRRLGYESETDANNKLNKCIRYSNVCRCKDGNNADVKHIFTDSTAYHQKKDRSFYEEGCEGENDIGKRHAPTNEHLKGIFNCRFSNPVNNAMKRKKKKPTSFVPVPVLNIPVSNLSINLCSGVNQENPEDVVQQKPMAVPFWRQPLPRNSMAGSSETEGSVASSRINIQLKLQEKKQKQLAELKIIEEEIKQGKLGRQKVLGVDNDECGGKVSLPIYLWDRQPAPRAKKHIDIETIEFRRNSSGSEAENMNILLHQLQHNNENVLYNNFSSTSGVAAALTKFSHEILTNININEKPGNIKQPSASSTSTTSENENNSLVNRQTVSSRKKLLHHNLANNLNVREKILPQPRTSPRIASPSCHYEARHSAYNSLEGKNKNDTNRSTNSKNENNGNLNSMEKDKSLANQLIKRQMQRGNTPEILLAPNHLDGNTGYYPAPSVPARNVICDNGSNYLNDYRLANSYEGPIDMEDEGDDSHIPSDIDSQMSLPRSYTLPREFKFNRQGRKIIKNEHFVASTNSSDGDVDSCDDNEFEDDDEKLPVSQRMRNRRTNNLNKNRILHTNSPFNNINPNINIMTQRNAYNLRTTGNMKVNNLDLINGCIDSRYESSNPHAIGSRQHRMTHFSQNRHETNL